MNFNFNPREDSEDIKRALAELELDARCWIQDAFTDTPDDEDIDTATVWRVVRRTCVGGIAEFIRCSR